MNGGHAHWWSDVSSQLIAGLIVACVSGGGLGYLWRHQLPVLLLVGLLATVVGAVWAVSQHKLMPQALISVAGICVMWPVFVGIDKANESTSPSPPSTTRSTTSPNVVGNTVRDLVLSCSPTTVAPGQTLTMTYSVETDGDDPWDLGMGAQLLGGRDPIFDKDNDAIRPFFPGSTDKTRKFTIDEATPPGEYDLVGVIWEGDIGSSEGHALEDDTCAIEVRAQNGLATIDCPAGGERYASAVPVARGTAETSGLADDQQLWLVSWSEAPVGLGNAAYLDSRIDTETWERRDVVIAEVDDPSGPVELRVYLLSQEQLDLANQRLDRNEPAGPYLTDQELDAPPQDKVEIIRNAPAPTPRECH